MDNSAHIHGNNSLVIAIILGIFSWLTPDRVDLGLRIITAIGAVTAAIFAARYHYYAAKEKKERIKRFQKDRKDDKLLG